MSYPQSTYTSVCRAATLRNTIRRIAVFDAVVGEWPMRVEHGFGPVWDAGSRVLVLGSVPSPKSREMRFYYGHPRNRFWPVMAAVFHDDRCLRECRDPDQIVGLRRDFALRHHMALWDVIESCDIDGASDASIRNAVPIPASCVVFGLTGASRLVAIRSYVPVREPSGAPNHAPLGGAARSVDRKSVV